MNDKQINKINNYVVTKSNSLIEAHYELSLTEQKIILFFVSKIRINDENFHRHTISVEEFCELIGYKGRPRYTELSEITKKLLSKVVEIKVGDKLKQFQWVSYVEYNTGKGTITLEFHEKMKPFLLQLKKEFTSYKLKNIMKLKSIYSIRIYEILKKWQPLKEVEIPLKELRKMVGAANKYAEYSNFKLKVLNVAKRELNKLTDIRFDFEEIKSGRKVVAIRFLIKSVAIPQITEEIPEQINGIPSEKEKNTNPDTEIEEVWFGSLFTELQILFKRHNIEGLSEKVVKNWIKLADEHWGSTKYIEIRKIAEEALNNKNVHNPIGFITYAVQKGEKDLKSKKITRKEPVPDWLSDWLEEIKYR
jgi:plasmid replication initiation protein